MGDGESCVIFFFMFGIVLIFPRTCIGDIYGSSRAGAPCVLFAAQRRSVVEGARRLECPFWVLADRVEVLFRGSKGD